MVGAIYLLSSISKLLSVTNLDPESSDDYEVKNGRLPRLSNLFFRSGVIPRISSYDSDTVAREGAVGGFSLTLIVGINLIFLEFFLL